ncbi:MAG: SDR family oxidoreductase [Actinomycetota bacterium]|nr:SDR family oxidoreductase [Actinomycetota bacterium]
MKLLVLGGTKFLGRAVVEEALGRGHDVTLFNRGRTNPGLFPAVEKLQGDRDGDLRALEGRRWDAVIDPSGYVPRVVRASAELLRDAVEHYVFVSSVSVYRSFARPGVDEDSAVIELEDPTSEEVNRDYGGLKALCERAVEDVFRGRCANVRAGLIVGPHDPTDRFTYWPRRIARGGEVLAPGRRERPAQFIDVRDLGGWIVELAENRTAGTFNATGPDPWTTMGELLDVCEHVAESETRVTWVDESFLLEHEVGQWLELPLWVAESDGDWKHLHEVAISRAVAAGLRFRPLEETVRDTLAWDRQDSSERSPMAQQVGLASGREAELLAAWRGA